MLLAALREKETGRDVRAVNNRRRAGILIRQLEKAREIEFNDVKNLTKVSE